MGSMGWIIKDHTVTADYCEMFDDGSGTERLMFIYIYTGDYKLYGLDERLVCLCILVLVDFHSVHKIDYFII